MERLLRHVLGLALGTGLFFVGIPAAFVALAHHVDPELGTAVAALPTTRTAIALVFAAVGLAFAASSNVWLVLVGRGGPADGFGVAVSPRTRHLVTTGPYRFTRNPMVFGMNLVYLALVVYLGSPTGLVALVLFVAALIPYLRWAEEERLLEDFGEEYLRYRRCTPLLLPVFPGAGWGGEDSGAASLSPDVEARRIRSSARGVFAL